MAAIAAIGLVGVGHLDHAQFQRWDEIGFPEVLPVGKPYSILHRLGSHSHQPYRVGK